MTSANFDNSLREGRYLWNIKQYSLVVAVRPRFFRHLAGPERADRREASEDTAGCRTFTHPARNPLPERLRHVRHRASFEPHARWER